METFGFRVLGGRLVFVLFLRDGVVLEYIDGFGAFFSF